MKKFLALITGVVCIAGVVSLHRTSAQECSDMSAYMIDASGQCINLEYLQNIGLPNENGEINGNDNGLIQKAADIDPIFTEVSTSSGAAPG